MSSMSNCVTSPNLQWTLSLYSQSHFSQSYHTQLRGVSHTLAYMTAYCTGKLRHKGFETNQSSHTAQTNFMEHIQKYAATTMKTNCTKFVLYF